MRTYRSFSDNTKNEPFLNPKEVGLMSNQRYNK